MHYLIVPGYSNSGPTHWQTYWTKSLPDASRVYQHSWDHPLKADWVSTLDETVSGLKTDTILVSHSLGVVTTVHWLLEKAAKGGVPGNIKA
ncbi:MAG: serine hydrolase family protein, partial [Fibrobacter sp.]|nr:serine hydrolase family protein [Fibrobacter sp.]